MQPSIGGDLHNRMNVLNATEMLNLPNQYPRLGKENASYTPRKKPRQVEAGVDRKWQDQILVPRRPAGGLRLVEQGEPLCVGLGP